MVNISFTQANVDAFAAYIAARLAQDNATITNDQALLELLMMAGIDPATVGTDNGRNIASGPSIRQHGGRFVHA
jgi:hypothetical protein